MDLYLYPELEPDPELEPESGPLNILCNCICAVQKEMAGEMIGVRSTVISQVLGTDMKKHFDILSRYQVRNVHIPSSCCLIQVLSLQHTMQLLSHLTFSCFPAFRFAIW